MLFLKFSYLTLKALQLDAHLFRRYTCTANWLGCPVSQSRYILPGLVHAGEKPLRHVHVCSYHQRRNVSDLSELVSRMRHVQCTHTFSQCTTT